MTDSQRSLPNDDYAPTTTVPDTPPAARSLSGHPSESEFELAEKESPGTHTAEVSVLELGTTFLDRWRLFLGIPLGAAVLAAGVALIIPPSFRATATFVPERGTEGVRLPGGLAGLASQFGVVAAAGGTSPQFYVQMVHSRTILDSLLLMRFSDPRSVEPGDSAPLLDILEVVGESREEEIERGRKQLRDQISATVDRGADIVNIEVETLYPTLSADVANALLTLLNRFNLKNRQSNARERRHFVEQRSVQAEAELRNSEERVRQFLEENRQFRGSPELQFQHERLQRQLSINEEVFTTLLRQYEEARIQEVNDTPVLTVIDRAVAPQEKARPRRRLMVLTAFFIGLLISATLSLAQAVLTRSRERDPRAFRQLAQSWATFKRDLRLFRGGRRSA